MFFIDRKKFTSSKIKLIICFMSLDEDKNTMKKKLGNIRLTLILLLFSCLLLLIFVFYSISFVYRRINKVLEILKILFYAY